MKELLLRHTVQQLRSEKNRNEQYKLLKTCSRQYPATPHLLKEYHDVLLYICAFPVNQKIFQLANDELKRLAGIIKNDFQKLNHRRALSGSGLPFTELQCQYSAPLVQWLIRKFPENIKPADTVKDTETVKQFFHALLPQVEFEHTTQGGWNLWNRVRLLCGEYKNREALQWLIQLIYEHPFSHLLKEQLYNSLKIFVQWNLTGDLFNRSFLRFPVTQIVYHDNKVKEKELSFSISKKIKEIQLSITEKDRLISIARASLALLYRETDPVTYSAAEDAKYFEMERGVTVLLTGMAREYRLSLDSYIGYTVFKNGVPVAYGGGWIFGYRCKIGVNIFPAFRGSESAFLFKQVLRLYCRYFNVKRFIVRPYQFGKGNTEGLKSGAFWFYYKMCFKPVDIGIKEFAETEWQKIKKNRQYRTPLNSLKLLAQSDLEMVLKEGAQPTFETGKVSACVTDHIIRNFKGNREEAIKKASALLMKELNVKSIKGFSKQELVVWNNWSLLWSCLPGNSNWNITQRKQYLKLVQLKTSGPEQLYIHALQKNSKLLKALNEMVNRY